MILLLQVSNPTAYAARSHLNRAEAALHLGSESGAPLDVAYLAGLGSDAVPVLVGRMGALTEAARCEVATALLSRWGPDPESDWRNWNLADWRARRLARTEGARLRAMAEGGGGCG